MQPDKDWPSSVGCCIDIQHWMGSCIIYIPFIWQHMFLDNTVCYHVFYFKNYCKSNFDTEQKSTYFLTFSISLLNWCFSPPEGCRDLWPHQVSLAPQAAPRGHCTDKVRRVFVARVLNEWSRADCPCTTATPNDPPDELCSSNTPGKSSEGGRRVDRDF